MTALQMGFEALEGGASSGEASAATEQGLTDLEERIASYLKEQEA